MPTTSVVIPCYNAEKFIGETIESVLKSDCNDWEIIIVDDGSSDNSVEVVKYYQKKDNRISYYRIPNQGPSFARNYGIEKAKGKYILPLDADDKISSDYISLATDILNKNNETKVVYAHAELFGNTNEHWELPTFQLKNLVFNNLIYCTAFYRKSDWSTIGGYDNSFTKGFEDWEFWIRMLKNGGEVYRIPKTCFYYRIRNFSHSSLANKMDVKQKVMKIIFQKHADFVSQYLPELIYDYNEQTQELNKITYEFEKLKKKFLVKLALSLSVFWKKFTGKS
jgi:glycosyltransferase involved in cell wall biosynthesis